MANLVAVRLYRENDLEKDWKTIPVASFMPVYLTGQQNDENLKKRLALTYFDTDSTILKIRWNSKGSDEGCWVSRPA